MNEDSKCPVTGGANKQATGRGTSNRDWWPNQLKIEMLHQHSSKSNPMGEDFNYAEEFKSLDLAAVKKDLAALMTAHRTGGRRTSATTALCSFGWRGTAPAPTAPVTAAAAAAGASSASRPSTVGPTTSASTSASPALADQAEVWPEDFMGRPDHPHGERRPGNDGIQNVRFRRRSRGRLGAGSGRLLGL